MTTLWIQSTPKSSQWVLNREKVWNCKVYITSHLRKTCSHYFKTRLSCNPLRHHINSRHFWWTVIQLHRDQKRVVRGPNQAQSTKRAINRIIFKLRIRSTIKSPECQTVLDQSHLGIRCQHKVWQRVLKSFMRRVKTILNKSRTWPITSTTQMRGNCSITKTIYSLALVAKWCENPLCTRSGRTCGKDNWRKKSSNKNRSWTWRMKTLMGSKKCQSKSTKILGNLGMVARDKKSANNWRISAQYPKNSSKCTTSVKSKTAITSSNKSPILKSS